MYSLKIASCTPFTPKLAVQWKLHARWAGNMLSDPAFAYYTEVQRAGSGDGRKPTDKSGKCIASQWTVGTEENEVEIVFSWLACNEVICEMFYSKWSLQSVLQLGRGPSTKHCEQPGSYKSCQSIKESSYKIGPAFTYVKAEHFSWWNFLVLPRQSACTQDGKQRYSNSYLLHSVKLDCRQHVQSFTENRGFLLERLPTS